MTKPYTCHETTDTKCEVETCPRKLKKNLIERNPNATLCYNHHQEKVRKNTAYRNGKKIRFPYKDKIGK